MMPTRIICSFASQMCLKQGAPMSECVIGFRELCNIRCRLKCTYYVLMSSGAATLSSPHVDVVIDCVMGRFC